MMETAGAANRQPAKAVLSMVLGPALAQYLAAGDRMLAPARPAAALASLQIPHLATPSLVAQTMGLLVITPVVRATQPVIIIAEFKCLGATEPWPWPAPAAQPIKLIPMI